MPSQHAFPLHLPPFVCRSSDCLIETGLTTVALGLLAFDLVDGSAGHGTGRGLGHQDVAYDADLT